MIFYDYFFIFINIGPYGHGRKTFNLLLKQITAKSFQTFPEFSSLNTKINGPHKAMLGIFEILKIEILTNFLIVFFNMFNMGPYGSKNFKTLLLQITAKSFQTSFDFSSQFSSPNCIFGVIKILKVEILTNFIRFR